MKPYLHSIPGRLRIRSAAIRNSETNAAGAKAFAEGIAGVRDVTSSTLTGSLKIVYDPAALGQETLLAALRAQGLLSAPAPQQELSQAMIRRASARLASNPRARRVAGKVTRYVVEAAIEKSVMALVGAVL